MLALFLAFIFCLTAFPVDAEELVLTLRSPESANDRRHDFEDAVVLLALEKTVPSHGGYRIERAPPMNVSRAELNMEKGVYPNFFAKFSYTDRLEALGLDYVRFPVDLGIIGYRVCFVFAEKKDQLAKVNALEDLKKFTHGQAAKWSDIEILRANGFKVMEAHSYENLFSMVAAGRFDLFCRGANELEKEWRAHSYVQNLTYDRSMVIHYPLPQFFYTQKGNRQALDRISEGLQRAYADGSLKALWEKAYRSSVNFAELSRRKTFRLDNPLLKKIDFNFQQYDFDQPVKISK